MVSLLSSRTSCAYFLPASFHAGLQKIAQRAEVQVQIALFELEVLGQLLHAAVELHEGLPEPLDLVVGERSGLHPPQCLALHELPQQLNEREDELRQALLDFLRIRVHSAPAAALRNCATSSCATRYAALKPSGRRWRVVARARRASGSCSRATRPSRRRVSSRRTRRYS